MRGPNAEAIKAECRNAIAPLLHKHGLGQLQTVDEDTNGWVNPCFFINGTHVMRFNARDAHLPKFQREKAAFDQLRAHSVPVPRNVTLDDSRELLPFDVLISERLPGENLESRWLSFTKAERESFAEQAGRAVSEIHKLTFPFFGELSERGPLPRTSTWWEYLKAKFELHLSEAAELNIFDEDTIIRFCEAFSNTKAALKEVTTPALVHGDAHPGNMLFAGNKITGVLDFEWAFAGDPLYDFIPWTRSAEIWPDSREGFLRGAGRPAFTESEQRRLKLYNLIAQIEVSNVAEKYFPAEEAANYKNAALGYLRILEN